MEANNFSPAAGYLQCEFPGKIIHKIFDDASFFLLDGVRVSNSNLVFSQEVKKRSCFNWFGAKVLGVYCTDQDEQ